MTYFVKMVTKKPGSKKVEVIEHKNWEKNRVEALLMNVRSFASAGYNIDLTVRVDLEPANA